MNTDISDIRKWTGATKSPSCKGNLRKQGVIEQSTREDLIEAGKMLWGLVNLFNVFTYTRKALLLSANAFRAGLKAGSVLRQCKSCGELASKCPKCKRVFHAGKKPGADGHIHTKCPHCGLKIAAWLITEEEVKKQEERQREISENWRDYDYWD